MEKINVYVTKLADDFGVNDLHQDEKKKILTELNEAFEERVIVNCLSKMSDGEKNELNKLISNETDFGSVLNFLFETVPNILSVLDESYLQLKKELLVDVKV
jgi:hypothetical protein